MILGFYPVFIGREAQKFDFSFLEIVYFVFDTFLKEPKVQIHNKSYTRFFCKKRRDCF